MNQGGARRGRVFDVQRFCVHDGPGIRTTVFLAGCPLRCAWCHNPEAFSGRSATWRTAAEVLAEVLTDQPFYVVSGGGLTVSGGEPLLQADFVRTLFQRAGQADLHRTLQTAGLVPWSSFEVVLGHLELVQFDLKHMDPARHRELTGVSNTLILENASRLAASGTPVDFRMPLIPGVNDEPAHLEAVAAFVQRLGVQTLSLVPYQRTYLGKYDRLGLEARLKAVAPPSPVELAAVVTHFKAEGLSARVDG